MTLFIVIILVWVLLGFFGVLLRSMNVDFVNWPMILFFLLVPFIPVVAKFCGLI